MDDGWSDMWHVWYYQTLHSPHSLCAAIVKVVYFLNAPAPSSPFSLFSHYCWAPRGSSLLVPSAQNINTQLSVKGSTYLRSFVECWSQQMPHHQHTWLAKNIMPRMNVFLKIGTSFCPIKWIVSLKTKRQLNHLLMMYQRGIEAIYNGHFVNGVVLLQRSL